MAAVAKRKSGETTDDMDLRRWIAYQEWLALTPCKVNVPFATVLSELVPPLAVRLRRDFTTVLNLIQAHALLHRVTRKKNADGTVIADVRDYESVRRLVRDFLAYNLEASVSRTCREVVEAVENLASEDARGDLRPVSVTDVARKLDIDKSNASRHIRDALSKGYLRNDEKLKGRPFRLLPGDALPEEVEVLPSSKALRVALLRRKRRENDT
jgi:hypothetical protein